MKKLNIHSLWFILVMILIIALLIEYLLNPHFDSISYWSRLLFIVILFFLTVLVYTKKTDYPKNYEKQFKKNEKAYTAQLRRKNMQIEDLKKRNEFLIKTALKQAERAKSISDQARLIFEGKKK